MLYFVCTSISLDVGLQSWTPVNQQMYTQTKTTTRNENNFKRRISLLTNEQMYGISWRTHIMYHWQSLCTVNSLNQYVQSLRLYYNDILESFGHQVSTLVSITSDRDHNLTRKVQLPRQASEEWVLWEHRPSSCSPHHWRIFCSHGRHTLCATPWNDERQSWELVSNIRVLRNQLPCKVRQDKQWPCII